MKTIGKILGLIALTVLISACEAPETQPTARIFTQAEFKQIAMGKTPEQVIAVVGPAFYSHKDDNGDIRLCFQGMVLDPYSGVADDANVKFGPQPGGVAFKIIF